MILSDRTASALGFGFIAVLDAVGDVVLSSQSAAPRAINRADSESFRYYAARADDGLHVSPPAISRLSGQWVMMLSRRGGCADRGRANSRNGLGIAVPHAASAQGVLTISGGIAGRSDTGIFDPAALVAAADEALYEAKRTGRDQVRSVSRTASMRLVAG